MSADLPPSGAGDAAPLASPALRDLLTWWQTARDGRPLPSRKTIDPLAFPRALSRIWLCDWCPDVRSGRMRLVGDDVDRLYGGGLKGKWLEETAGPATRARLLTVYRRVAEGPCLYHARGRVYQLTHDLYGEGERMILPLADDGDRVSHLIGATEFALNGDPVALPDTPDTGGRDEVWETFAPVDAARQWLGPTA